ncbi:MAG: RHS repeat-associated core domain-containing protein [Candidatus Cryptobacteroides sp.]|nr:RHS repeat-associated core domain-containing protein [Candidatus Cryptobacteroides sp.]
MNKLKLFCAALMLASSIAVAGQNSSSASDTPIYKRGKTCLESTLPPSPEAASVVKYADIPFIHSTGAAQLDIPFHSLKGKELTINVGLSYVSQGIKLDEVAGVAGLGWKLNAGGCVTRTVMDMPDEFSSPHMTHQLPSETLLDKLIDPDNVDNDKINYLTQIIRHKKDAKLDRYSYEICGLSGSFVILDNGQVRQLSGDGVVITYTRNSANEISSFRFVGPDGIVYTLSETERATHDASNGQTPDILTGEVDKWDAFTAWYLSSVTSRSGLEQALFTYDEGPVWRKTLITKSSSVSMSQGPNRNVEYGTGCSIVSLSYTTKILKSISLDGETIAFSYSAGTGTCNHLYDTTPNYPVRLTRMEAGDINGRIIRRLDLGTRRDIVDGRIILNSLTFRGLDSDIYDKWSFVYDSPSERVSHFAQDWYGYHNGTTCGFTDYAPFHYTSSISNPMQGSPDAGKARLMSLLSCNHNGAETEFVYEGNTIGSTSVGVRVKSILSRQSNLTLAHGRIRSFVYEEPVADGPIAPTQSMYCTVEPPFSVADMTGGSVTWTFTLHETPVVKGPSIRDTRVYYKKVTEILSSSYVTFNTKISKTVRYYDTSASTKRFISVQDRFPSLAADRFSQYPPSLQGYDPYDGIKTLYTDEGPVHPPVLTRVEEYAWTEEGMRLVDATNYDYDSPAGTQVLVDYVAEQVWKPVGVGNISYDYILHYPIYASTLMSRQQVTKSVVHYHLDGRKDSTAIATKYLSRTANLEQPSRVSSIAATEGRKKRTLSYTYADKRNNAACNTLASQHCLAVPVARTYTIEDVKLPVRILKGGLGELSIKDSLALDPNWSTAIPLDSVVIRPIGNYRKKEEITFGYVDSLPGCLLPCARIEYTDGQESWREDYLKRDSRGNIVELKQKGSPNTVVLWGYEGKYPVAVIANATLAQVDSVLALNGNDINGLRVALPLSHVSTFTYNPGLGLASITDESGVVTSFEYDFAGRLAAVKDAGGHTVEDYVYDLLEEEDGDGLLSVLHRTYRSEDGNVFAQDKSWWNTLGLKDQDIAVKAAGDGRDLITVYESDFLLHDDVKTWMPYPVPETGGTHQAQAKNAAAAFHGNDKAFTFKGYEISNRNRVLTSALPGYQGEHENSVSEDAASSFPKYEWKNSGISTGSAYKAWEIVKTVSTDADGRIRTAFHDHSGRLLASSRGDDAPAYYIYDSYDRLRAVASAGIELTDTLNMWRYSYDRLDRMSSKGIPGCIREVYAYDQEDRLISVTKGSELREITYDNFGRITQVHLTQFDGSRALLEEHFYDSYPDFEGIAAIIDGWTGPVCNLETCSRVAILDADGEIEGYAQQIILYDAKARPVRRVTRFPDEGILTQDIAYNFPGEISDISSTFSLGGRTDSLCIHTDYDIRGRMTGRNTTLIAWNSAPQSLNTSRFYDEIGRPALTTISSGNHTLSRADTYRLQGWMDSRHVTLDGNPVFDEVLSYDDSSVPSYTGLITGRQEGRNGVMDNYAYEFQYDGAGRLSREARTGIAISSTDYTYDARGNILNISDIASTVQINWEYSYNGDILTQAERSRRIRSQTYSFAHDSLGRMTFDGLNGLSVEYNHLNLPRKIWHSGSTLVNYSYLADGTKNSSLTQLGEGLVYRGPFTYRRASDGTLTLESAVCDEGRLTPERALLYVRDHLGSVRAVVDGNSAEILEASNYGVYGSRSELVSAGTIPGLSFRDHFTGKEDQKPDFGIPYNDHGARLYAPSLRRWTTPDPLSEKYYGISPYAYCDDNPLNAVDPDGRFPDFLWDIANVAMDVYSLVESIEEGNSVNIALDGVALVVDTFAAIVPFVPGGMGTALKVSRGIDTASDILRLSDKATDATKVEKKVSGAVKNAKSVNQKTYQTYTKTHPITKEVYVGRTSGTLSPEANVRKRDKNHHMNKKGFGPAKLDNSSSNPDAIRGLEQHMIELNGGAKVNGGTSGNTINGVSPTNPKAEYYEQQMLLEFFNIK